MEPQGSCTVCARNDPRRGPVCEWCRQRMRDWLDELAALWTHELPEETLTGAGRLNLLALDLLIPVPSIHAHRLRDGVTDGLVPHIVTEQRVVTVEVDGGTRDVVVTERHLVRNGDGSPALVPAGDQQGEVPVVVWADQWVRYWRDAHQERTGSTSTLPAPTLDRLGWWLRRSIDWAADNDRAFPDFADELREQLGLLRRVTGMQAAPLPVPCPNAVCDMLTLVRWPYSEWDECRACHALVGPRRIPGQRDPQRGEYDRWVDEQVAALDQQGGAA